MAALQKSADDVPCTILSRGDFPLEAFLRATSVSEEESFLTCEQNLALDEHEEKVLFLCTSCKRQRWNTCFSPQLKTCIECLESKKTRRRKRVVASLNRPSHNARTCSSCKSFKTASCYNACLKTCKNCLNRRKLSAKQRFDNFSFSLLSLQSPR